MAKAKPETQKEQPKTDVVVKQQHEVVDASMAAMYAEDAARGFETATEDSYAIPFLSVLQPMSPQVDEADGKFIEGAKAGMLYENITGQLIDGKTGAIIIPCHYRRVFLRWGPRGGDGGGFKGEISQEDVASMRQRKEIVEFEGRLYVPLPDGSVNEKRCDRIVDTRNHYVLLVNEETGQAVQALLSLRSTQIKKSKALMSLLASVREQGPNGPFQPASFASQIRVTTVPEKNDEGNWHGVRFEREGRVTDPRLYQGAKAFYETVKKGAVEVKYEEQVDSESGAGGQRRAAPSQEGNRF